ncbi:MAG: YgfZ family protein [Acidimicrobiales bacterium]
MTPATALDPLTRLEWSRITARGSEAERFLQGQVSQDVSLADANGVWTLVLSPTSEVITSALLRRRDGYFELLVASQVGELTLSRLARFLLRTDCQLELEVGHEGPVATIGEQVRGGVPGPSEFAKDLTPQCFGNNFVATTVSFSKGCFTGQELVGRLDARGAVVPWRLVRAEGPSIERLDEVLCSKGPEGPQGVTTAVTGPDGVVALGFVHRSALTEGALDLYSDVKVIAIA